MSVQGGFWKGLFGNYSWFYHWILGAGTLSCSAYPQSKQRCGTKLHFLLNFKEINPSQLLLSIPFMSSISEKRRAGSQGCAAPKPMPMGTECIAILPPSSNKSQNACPGLMWS